MWHGLQPPYEDLFAWLEGRAEAVRRKPRPLPPGHAGPGDRRGGRLRQARSGRLRRRMEVGRHPRAGRGRARAGGGSTPAAATTSRGAFPDILEALDFEGVIDGELLVVRDGRGGTASPTCSSG